MIFPEPPNTTCWQRLYAALLPEVGQTEAMRLATVLLPVMVAERKLARRAVAA